MKFYQTFFVSICPGEFSSREGYIPGLGLNGTYEASLDECSNDCIAINECSAFEHSDTQQNCTLLSQLTPTQSKYQDFEFCSLLGKYFVCVAKNFKYFIYFEKFILENYLCFILLYCS